MSVTSASRRAALAIALLAGSALAGTLDAARAQMVPTGSAATLPIPVFAAPAPSGDTTGVTDYAALQAAIIACFGNRANPTAASTFKIFQLQQGTYYVDQALLFESVSGAVVQGAGRFATTIQDASGNAGNGCIATNGCQFSRFSDFNLVGNQHTVACFDLNWDNSSARNCALQSNTLLNISFGGPASNSQQVGLQIGADGFMGSENLILNCFFGNSSVAGLKTSNFNALQNTVIGGNFQANAIGIWVHSGSVPLVYSVGFQLQSTFDIQVDNAAGDGYAIIGCRTESTNFVLQNVAGTEITLAVTACTQTASAAGIFVQSNCPTIIDSCSSTNGQLRSHRGGTSSVPTASSYFYLRNWNPGRQDWQSTGSCSVLQPDTRPVRPDSIANLALWFEADPSTMTFGPGSAISQWRDKSANLNHLSQGTSGNQPTLAAPSSTVPWGTVQFTSAAQSFMSLASSIDFTSTGWTFIAASMSLAGAAGKQQNFLCNATTTYGMALSDEDLFAQDGTSTGNQFEAVINFYWGNPTAPYKKLQVYAATQDTSNNISLYFNGQSISSFTAEVSGKQASGWVFSQFGGNSDVAAVGWSDMNVRAFLAFTRPLTPKEIAAASAYLQSYLNDLCDAW